MKSIEFLNPEKLLVDEVVSYLCGDEKFSGRIKSVDSAKSLTHVMVVVPTAQSGRNLRLALAKEASRRGWHALLSPRIVMANSLLAVKDAKVSSPAEELAVMASILLSVDIDRYKSLFPRPPQGRSVDWALDMAGVVLEVKDILAEAALLIADVKAQADAERWRDLVRLENLFIDSFRSKGVLPRCIARRVAAEGGCREDGIEEIVLPSAVDIQRAFISYLENSTCRISVLIHARQSEEAKFDDWGRPVRVFSSSIAPELIESFPTAIMEADAVARFFRAVKPDEAYPALVACDAEMHPELEGAFQNHFSADELVLRNPSKEMLIKSSLGRLLSAIVLLEASGDYEIFSTLVRMGDIARWAKNALSVSAEDIAKFVGVLDMVQNAHLPRTIDEVISAAQVEADSAHRAQVRQDAAGLVRLAKAVKAEIADPFVFLRKIFSSITLDEKKSADRELIAAAEAVRELRAACSSELIPQWLRKKLFARLLPSASYMLEPTAENVLATTGWLEVPWSLDKEIAVVGFNEGCVPENVVGHPFLPDALRKELGIKTNAEREIRDSFIFAQAISCRCPGAVSVSMHQLSGDKNVMKPSRILFNGVSDKHLPELAMRLYAVTKGNAGAPAKELPEAWRLKLPLPPKGIVFREQISPTRLDEYLRCPFTFYLKEVFSERADDRNQELDSMAFGNLCHGALDRLFKVGPRDSTSPQEIADFLADEVRRQLRSFGERLPAVIELQGEAAIERLEAFANIQAARRREGWRIVSAEQSFQCRIKNCPTLLKGKVDRIDCHETTGELAIIDYKTWNRAKESNYLSIQLPVYRAMVEASGLFDLQKARQAKAFYCILAERKEDVVFDEAHAYHEGGQSAAEDKIVGLLTDLAKGIFYPAKKVPGNYDWEWTRNYGSLIWESPEKGIDLEWLRDQAFRKEVQE